MRASDSAPPLQGWFKRRQLLGFWGTCFATLTGNLLSLSNDISMKGLVHVALAQDTQIDILDKEKSTRFRIANPGGDEVFLEADGEEACRRWVSHFATRA
jgi:hypothetical protein